MTRSDILAHLPHSRYDLVIIGGGASGAGLALEASHQGAKVLLLEAQDFMAGTSSRSTKLLHGGVRYLEQAIKNRDPSKYQLVKDALGERKRLLAMAPHLCRSLRLVTPCAQRSQQWYYFLGLSLYQQLAGKEAIGQAQRHSADAMRQMCPSLNEHYRYGVSYFDGQFDDARFGISMLRTAEQLGAHMLNYCALSHFSLRDGRVAGLSVTDQLTGRCHQLVASQVINASGPQVDRVRQLANPDLPDSLQCSRGSHLVLPGHYCRDDTGWLIPNTSDGRVLFMLPWQGYCLLGTTDDPDQDSLNPSMPSADADYLLAEIRPYLRTPVSDADVSGHFTGLRPLAKAQPGLSSSQMSRDHQILMDDTGLISLLGGKWTTWRKMALDCLHVARQKFVLPLPAQRPDYRLVGAQLGVPQSPLTPLDADIHRHLYQQYGDLAPQVAELGPIERILPNQPFITNELIWAFEQEYCQFTEDLLHRRWRVGIQNVQLAAQLADRIHALRLWPRH